MTAAYIVGGTCVRFIHAIILFYLSFVSVFSQQLHVTDPEQVSIAKNQIKFKTMVIITHSVTLTIKIIYFLFDEGRAIHLSIQRRKIYTLEIRKASPCFLEQLPCYHGN